MGSDGRSRETAWATSMRSLPLAGTNRLTSVRVSSVTLLPFRSRRHVASGEYFAPIGQMGVHVSLRQQALRPLYGIEFLADGWLHIGIPAADTQPCNFSRLYESGSLGSGNGFPRGSISAGPCSPETPMRSSASW